MAESKIDTALFMRTADTMSGIAKEMGSLFQSWNKTVSGLRGCWQGDSSDNIKNTADQVQKSAESLLGALAGYRAALLEIAGIYDKTEKNVTETGKSLKFDKTFQ